MPPAGVFSAMSSKTAIACLSVVPNRSSSTETTRATASACETSSGYAAFMRSTTAPVSAARNAPSMPSFFPWRIARRMILRRT